MLRPRPRRLAREPEIDEAAPPPPPLHAVLELQRSAGNQAIAGLLARQQAAGAIDLFPADASTPQGRLKVVAKLGPVDAATVHQQLKAKPDAKGKSGIDLPDGSYIIDAAEIIDLQPVALARKEQVFKDFATRREPLFDAMRKAADAKARHEAAVKLSAFDAGELPTLQAMQNAMGGEWDIEDAKARDAVLAAIQLQAATGAEGELLGDYKTIRDRVKKAAGMETSSEWCGFFTADHYVQSKMDNDLRSGFFHTHNVDDFFHYIYWRYPTRIKKWIWADERWQELHAYHTARGSERQWLDAATLAVGGDLDIRPGDTALIDRAPFDGDPDHIAQAYSYDPTTSKLVTIGGNDVGFQVVKPGEAKATGTDADRTTAEEATGRDLKPASPSTTWASACATSSSRRASCAARSTASGGRRSWTSRTVARQLGHGADLTLSTYGHTIDELDEAPRITADEAIAAAGRSRPVA